MKNPKIPGLEIPIRTIYCIGRNYTKHAREMGNTPPKTPLVFIKPLSSICFTDSTVQLPDISTNVHHEAELVVAIGKEGSQIIAPNAKDYIAGYGVGIDFTARDLQQEAKQKGAPWTIAKGFDHFAPISKFLPPSEVDNIRELDVKLFVNSFIKQHGNTSEMIFSIDELIAYLSNIFTLYPGDLIFTGTPSGVGPVHKGDHVEAMLENGLATVNVTIA